MEQEPKEKLALTQEQVADLRIFFMIARPLNIQITNEKVIAILAYSFDTAINKARTEAQGLDIVYYGQTLPVKELISKLYLDNVIILPPSSEIPKVIQPEDIKKINKEAFKAGLLLVLSDYVEVDADRDKLKEIIDKI